MPFSASSGCDRRADRRRGTVVDLPDSYPRMTARDRNTPSAAYMELFFGGVLTDGVHKIVMSPLNLR